MATGVRLQGFDSFVGRLHAIQTAFVPIAKAWGEDASKEAKARVHSPRGRIRSSIHPGPYNSRQSKLMADYRSIFIDRGTVPHPIELKSVSGSGRGGPGKARVLTSGYPPRSERTVFGRRAQHPGMRPRPFIVESAERALEQNPMSDKVIALWNGAGGQAKLALGGGLDVSLE